MRDRSRPRPAVHQSRRASGAGGTMWLSWRVTPDTPRRDEAGRLYASFEDRIVLDELSTTSFLLDREERSGSSGKIVRRLIIRTATSG
jgi:hypothetical protein